MSTKNQITIPVAVMAAAGISAGDDVLIRAAGPGLLEIERSESFVDRFAGSLPPGTYGSGYLDALRDEWRG